MEVLRIRLREVRKAKRLSQTTVGNLAGCGQEKVSAYEIGKQQPRYTTLIHLADALQVSTDYLLGRIDDMDRKVELGDVLSKDEVDLEPIHKISMNGDKLAPNNHSAGKMDQSKIVLCLFLKADEQFAETVEKRMRNFDYPAFGLEVRVTLYFFALLTSGTNMGGVLAYLNRLGTACITSIQAKILWMLFTDRWTSNNDFIQRCF